MGNHMARVAGAVLAVLLFLCCPAPAQQAPPASLPLNVRADLLAAQISDAMEHGEYRAALRLIDGLKNLESRGAAVPASIFVQEATAAREMGDPRVEESALKSFLERAPSTDPFYATAQQRYPEAQRANAARTLEENARHCQEYPATRNASSFASCRRFLKDAPPGDPRRAEATGFVLTGLDENCRQPLTDQNRMSVQKSCSDFLAFATASDPRRPQVAAIERSIQMQTADTRFAFYTAAADRHDVAAMLAMSAEFLRVAPPDDTRRIPIEKQLPGLESELVKSAATIVKAIEQSIVGLPGGTFTMGRAYSEQPLYSSHQQPPHEVKVPPFGIARTEVTCEQWYVFVVSERSPLRPGCGNGKDPVDAVPHAAAKAFTDWLSRETKARYRLPSEAEWEFAARGGTTTDYPWGDGWADGHANCAGTSAGDTWEQRSPVGQMKPNQYGLFDMIGNVDELVEDAWHANYVGAPADASPWAGVSSRGHVTRGGSWSSQPRHCHPAYRAWTGEQGGAGLRVVREAARP